MQQSHSGWALAAALALAVETMAAGPFEVNLLTNPGGETGDMSGWNITLNGGNGWTVFSSASYADSGTRFFATSHQWDTRQQTIDLLSAGFSSAELSAQPTIVISEKVSAYWGGQYFVDFSLQDEAFTTLASFSQGTIDTPCTLPFASTNWISVGTTFSGYGATPRYVVFKDGGVDTRGWAGNYGTTFDSANVSVIPEPTTAGSLAAIAFAGWGIARRRRASRPS